MSVESPAEAGRKLVDAAVTRAKALTPAQLARREEVARRTAIISAGVRPPASGVFGGAKRSKEAKR